MYKVNARWKESSAKQNKWEIAIKISWNSSLELMEAHKEKKGLESWKKKNSNF